jgi:hypothetical protein
MKMTKIIGTHQPDRNGGSQDWRKMSGSSWTRWYSLAARSKSFCEK